MIRSSRDTIRELIGYGVDFARAEDGTLLYTREGAHSKPRILYHEDETGKEITSRLLSQVRSARPNVQIIENTAMVDLICQGDTCRGVVIRRADGSYDTVPGRLHHAGLWRHRPAGTSIPPTTPS